VAKIESSKPVEVDPPEPKESCGHPAGSMERIAAYRKRVERGEALYHPSDSKAVVGPIGGLERDARHAELLAIAESCMRMQDLCLNGTQSSLSTIVDKNDLHN
jgi:hypothetical protein